MSAWTDHVERWRGCQACPLGRQRGEICLARGEVPCDILLIGEAPGSSEDALGQPFVGPAGERLDAVAATALAEWQVPGTAGPGYNSVVLAYTNLVACFPRDAKAAGTNEPERGEILACRPRLDEFIRLARPRLIVCVGTLAEQYVDHAGGVPCCDIIHPAATFPPRMTRAQAEGALRRATVVLRSAWEDVLQSGKQFSGWRQHDAGGKATRAGLRAIYGATADDIPF